MGKDHNSRSTRKAEAWAHPQSEYVDHITAGCADLSIQSDQSEQDNNRTHNHHSQTQKKRRADGSLKLDQTWSMMELSHLLQTQCTSSQVSDAKLRRDADNLRRRIAMLEGSRSGVALHESHPARYRAQQDMDCDRKPSLREDCTTDDILDWNSLREDVIR